MAGITGQFDDCEDTPREVDLLTEEHVEDLLDAVECLRGKVEQLQVHCEKLMFEKGKVENQLIEKDKASLETKMIYEKELASLRNLNIHLMSGLKEDSMDVPSWVKDSKDAELSLKEKIEAENKAELLKIALREKDKQISNLEWQVIDAESTITSIQAERDKLAVELDCMLAREEDDLALYRDTSADRTVFSDDEYDKYSSDRCETSVKRHPRRHLSDLTHREDSQIDDLTDLVGRKCSALSNNDVPSATEFQFQSGLKRTTNFNDINNVDEFTDFHDNNLNGRILMSGSNWCSFGSDSDTTMSPLKTNQSQQWNLSDLPSNPATEGSVEGCFDDASDWALDGNPLGSLGGGKNGSCRSSSSAYFSDNSACLDPWTFTPDSILDVSTGEELKVTPPGSKNSLASDSALDIFKTKRPHTKEPQEQAHCKDPVLNNTSLTWEKTTSRNYLPLEKEHDVSTTRKTNLFESKDQIDCGNTAISTAAKTIENEKSENTLTLDNEAGSPRTCKPIVLESKENVFCDNTELKTSPKLTEKSRGKNNINFKNKNSSLESSGPSNLSVHVVGKTTSTAEPGNSRTIEINSSQFNHQFEDKKSTLNMQSAGVGNKDNKNTFISENEVLKTNRGGMLDSKDQVVCDNITTSSSLQETFRPNLLNKNDANESRKNKPQHGLKDGNPSFDNLERTCSVRSDGAIDASSKEGVCHQRINSEPLPRSASSCQGKDGVIKLQAYQKWRMSGKKGQPPTKLKISQC